MLKTILLSSLVVYFSATGRTKVEASRLSEVANADLWEIMPAEPYTDADLDWRNEKSRSSIEMTDAEARPMLKACTNITNYDVIYIGFPIWWGIVPRIVYSWIDNNDLSGKRLIPFATSGTSPIEPAVADMRKTYPQYPFEDGILMNFITDKELADAVKKHQ